MATQHTTTSHPLVIVESPNKVKTISKILGNGFTVRASYGHFADIPATHRGVDVANNFHAEYSLSTKGREIMDNLRNDLASASELILATDDDREGEMIAHLLVEFLEPKVPVSRIVFHAITKADVLASLDNRRQINANVVEAARTRRVLDHLYGFQVSPVLWSKVRQNLGAGRVQSPALRLVVEREQERLNFVATTYAGIDVHFDAIADVTAHLATVDNVKVATSSDIADDGQIAPDAMLLEVAEAQRIAEGLTGVPLVVTDVKTQRYTRKPRRPYITSDLLADVLGQLRIGSKSAQALLNQLHEKGLISYPRTDNPALSVGVTHDARQQAVTLFGADAVPAKPRLYFAKKKSAQEAHEAIRPTNLGARTPAGLTAQQQAVYDLIWRRTVASQMLDTTGTTHIVTFTVTSASGHACHFTASGTTIHEAGHRRLSPGYTPDAPTPLETVAMSGEFTTSVVEVTESVTKAPARFTEASLIRALEEREIGRPSTYASSIDSLRNEYLWSKDGDQALIPTLTGVAVEKFMAERFPNLVDFEFTRQMEERLSRIVEGDDSLAGLLTMFYFSGDGQWPSLESTIADAMANHDPRLHPVRVLGVHPETGDDIVLRAGKSFVSPRASKAKRSVGRRRTAKRSTGSPYIKCGDKSAAVPDQTELATLTVEYAVSLLDAPRIERMIGLHHGEPVTALTGPYGPYLKTASKNVSLPAEFDLATVELADVAHLLAFPRLLGVDPSDGVDVVVKLGRHGAYVDKAGDTRSVPDARVGATLTLDDALSLLARPKKKRGKG